MRMFTVRSALLLIAPLLFIELQAEAQEAISTTSSSGSATTSAPAASIGDVSRGTGAPAAAIGSAAGTPALEGGPSGVGVFSRTPVQIYANISGGYDDNVSTSQNTKQGSAFTSGNVILDYTFGDPRLQLILNGGAGGAYYYEQVNGQKYDIDLKGALAI